MVKNGAAKLTGRAKTRQVAECSEGKLLTMSNLKCEVATSDFGRVVASSFSVLTPFPEIREGFILVPIPLSEIRQGFGRLWTSRRANRTLCPIWLVGRRAGRAQKRARKKPYEKCLKTSQKKGTENGHKKSLKTSEEKGTGLLPSQGGDDAAFRTATWNFPKLPLRQLW